MTDAPDRPTLFALHGLGLSSRLFGPLADALGDEFDVVALDLPGFGDARETDDYDVGDMADRVLAAIARSGATRWLLVGHSMGGKIASVVAARALSGERPVFGLLGVVLLAGSPPVPEPMDEDRRAQMLGWAAGGPLDEDAARTFVEANTSDDLTPERVRIAVDDVLRSDPAAWTAWLERGSREDWSEAVGRIDIPALFVAGGDDADLGEPAQVQLNGAAYPSTPCEVIDGVGHMLPFEAPERVADLIRTFWRERAGTGPVVPAAFARALASPRAGARVRRVAGYRALADDPLREPLVLDAEMLATLRGLADVLVPQSAPRIDLAARVDAQLATGVGDGWRVPDLPPDAEAYRRLLPALSDLVELDPDARRGRVARLLEGSDDLPDGTPGALVAAWLQDVAVDLARQWLAHPATGAAIGYDGALNGGDGLRQQGFRLTGLDQRERWEPLALGRRSAS